MYEIVIADNGSGFPPETLQRLQEKRYDDPAGGRSLGIRNVHNRLMIKFGESVTITFRNRTDPETGALRGAEVMLRLPANTDQEEDDDV